MGRGRGEGNLPGVRHKSSGVTEKREYRMEELARLAGITVRTLRFYRERKLIPPPRREGRIAWYDDHHLPVCAPSRLSWSAATPSPASRNSPRPSTTGAMSPTSWG